MKRNKKGQFVKGQFKDYTNMRSGNLVALSYSHTVCKKKCKKNLLEF